jgi:hypothetical protein
MREPMIAYEFGKEGLQTCKKLFEKVFDRVQLPFPNKEDKNFF